MTILSEGVRRTGAISRLEKLVHATGLLTLPFGVTVPDFSRSRPVGTV